MYAEDSLVPLSALQHFVVCPRQCALIHLERAWLENARTAEGRALHERVDRGGNETRAGIRRVCGVPLRSLVLGVAGRADVVEFRTDPKGGPDRPYPVEHKRGKPKRGDEDRVQLCAQAICLEEMTGVAVPKGALFYGEKRRRVEVVFDKALRTRVKAVAESVHALFRTGVTPPPPDQAPCAGCSLRPLCRPEAMKGQANAVAGWIAARLGEKPARDGPP